MSLTTNSNYTGPGSNTVLETWEQGSKRIEQAQEAKTDISFMSIFANLIKKMDDAAQAAQ
ncbi:MAG: hypothetical protein V7642_669 [Burkholderiales bacterium]|jgi:hypothetical protein